MVEAWELGGAIAPLAIAALAALFATLFVLLALWIVLPIAFFGIRRCLRDINRTLDGLLAELERFHHTVASRPETMARGAHQHLGGRNDDPDRPPTAPRSEGDPGTTRPAAGPSLAGPCVPDIPSTPSPRSEVAPPFQPAGVVPGKVFEPTPTGPRKHPCPECFQCLWCSDSRCAACRPKRPPELPARDQETNR